MRHPIEEAILFLLEIQSRHPDEQVGTRAKELEAAVRACKSLPVEHEKSLPAEEETLPISD
jgi:hypothetical protein